MKRFALLVAIAALGGSAWTQTSLTLDEALNLARSANGSVRAAYLDYEAAKASAAGARSGFLPSVTASYGRINDDTKFLTGANRGWNRSNSNDARVTAEWTVFDSGDRSLNYRQRQLSAEAAELNALQTLRRTVFDVFQRYYDALRAEELLKVQRAQVRRSEEILKQTEFRARPDVGDGPKKDILQARADFLNARASELAAVIRVDTTKASLKAIVGLDVNSEPALVAPSDLDQPATLTQSLGGQIAEMKLEDAFRLGIETRPDLQATRKRLDAQKQNVRLAKNDRGLKYDLKATAAKSFGDGTFEQGRLAFNISFPLFDGKRSEQALRSEELTYQSIEASLEQSIRDARAEIESAYKELRQNLLRLEASALARDAARLNYQAAEDSRKEGASNLIEVLTAQVTLATAESNYVEAYYDTLISEVRLRLATGGRLPGEIEG